VEVAEFLQFERYRRFPAPWEAAKAQDAVVWMLGVIIVVLR
jgi:hypothetical protein